YTNAFEGARSIVLIDGLSGTGKSALVHELFKILKNFQGVKTYYIAGKFDQFQKSIPYNAFNQAFNSYIAFVLSENKEYILSKKNDILKAMDGNGSVLLEIIPSLELVTGKLDKMDELDPTQAQNRLYYIFKKFLLTICNEANPIVLFIDDLQWADSGSLGLIKILLNDPDIKHLLFIGAYRTNEVLKTHPLSIIIEDAIEDGNEITQLTVGNLNIHDIRTLLAETLYNKEEEVADLAELVLAKTSGNAFFVNQFLRSLYEKKLIYFDDKDQTQNPKWKWDLEKIILEKITDNVVSLMTEKIVELSSEVVYLLQIAACIGIRFRLQILSLVIQKNLRETFLILWEAIQKNLLVPVGEYKIFLTSNEVIGSRDIDLEINFIHDRVQQSAYSLIKEDDRKKIHHQIGKIYFQELSLEDRKDRIFEIIHHLNYGSDLIISQNEISDLIHLNYSTGKRAKQSGAYEASLSYFQKGLELMRRIGADSEVLKLRIDFLSEAAETSWLLSQIGGMTAFSEEVLMSGKTPFEKIKVYKVLITYNVSMGNGIIALEKASEILKEFGVGINIFPNQIEIVKELIRMKFALIGKKISDLANQKLLEDKKQLAIIDLLSIASSPAYTASPNLLPILIFKQVYMSAKFGIAEASPFAYMSMALISCGALNDIESGYEFGKLGLKLLEKNPSPEIGPKTNVVFNTFVRFWKEHLRNTLGPLLEAYKKSLDVGDLEFAGIGCYIYTLHCFHTGRDLGTLIREMKNYSEILDSLNQSDRLPYHRMLHQLVAIYYGSSHEPDKFRGDIYDPEEEIPVHLKRKDRTAIFTVYFCKGLAAYNFGKMKLAIDSFNQALEDQEAVVASPNLPVLFFYLSLAYIGYAKETKVEKKALKNIKSNQKKLKFWSKYAPENFLHKYYLVEAELANLLGNEDKAKQLYDLAILHARKNEYINEEALAWELGGKYYSGKNEILAEMFLQKAYTCYMKWGAFAKTKNLETLYPGYIRSLKGSQPYRDTSISKTHSMRKSTMLVTSSNRMDSLDINSILKASQALSSEIELPILITRLMRLMAENAGAEKGYLILEEDGEYWLESKYGADNGDFARVKLSEFENIPSSIVNYVINSKLSIMLENATDQSAHTDDYIKTLKPKSILCMPLLNRGEMTGILYLENNLIAGAFTEQSLNILSLLSSQASISIQNARFYKHLKRVNQSYERFVPREFLQLLDKKSILDVDLGQFTEREMTILFGDIRDFTQLSEEMTPEENFKFINSFLRRMEPAISKNNGFIDKYIGDAIMALFKKADDALLAAIDMRSNLSIYNMHREKHNYQHIRVGIGINTGDLMLGTIGGKARMDGTVISDAVNLAARIESLTKTFHVPILISEFLVEKLENRNQFYIREIDRLRVKGKQKPVTMYECFNCDKQSVIDRKLESMELYIKGLNAFREENFYEAIDFFNECQVICPEDPIPVIYINRCSQMIRDRNSKQNKEKFALDEIGSRKALLIDDNAAFLEITSHVFSKKGYDVLTAESEKTALLKYENFLPDIVFTDLHLSEGTSYT
ncbi:MAG TPA: adenylate/guanylate cyclase domain-containing protein, partial [Leptospiraceae bacterium]|nr:adenylate/guanylate cyclase domain-containing protein [Leptospiraceae bacterium]